MSKKRMQEPATMTNGTILKEYERLLRRQSEIGDVLIAAGLGHTRPSDVRENPDLHPICPEYMEVLDRLYALRHEATRRTGHSSLAMSFLGSQSKRYRRLRQA